MTIDVPVLGRPDLIDEQLRAIELVTKNRQLLRDLETDLVAHATKMLGAGHKRSAEDAMALRCALLLGITIAADVEMGHVTLDAV